MGKRQAPSPAAIRSQGGRTVLEAVLVLLFLMAVLTIAIERYVSSLTAVREAALAIELSNLRSAVTFYTMLNKRLPRSLKALIEEKAVVERSPGIEGREYDVVIIGKFVESMAVDSEGFPTDPFGGRYGFDPATGRIWSATPGYEKW